MQGLAWPCRSLQSLADSTRVQETGQALVVSWLFLGNEQPPCLGTSYAVPVASDQLPRFGSLTLSTKHLTVSELGSLSNLGVSPVDRSGQL